MWVTEELSLVDFYKSSLGLAREAGYEVVISFIAREADAPDVYDKIVQAWNSIDDLTGPNILFLFAGTAVRSRYQSESIVRGSNCLQFSADALMLHSRAMSRASRGILRVVSGFDLKFLRDKAKQGRSGHQAEQYTQSSRLAVHHPHRPDRERIVSSQNPQIRQLREHLKLDEGRVPCLHFTFLDGTMPIIHEVDRQADIYATLKAIVESIESEAQRKARSELVRIRSRLDALEQDELRTASKPISPIQLFHSVISQLDDARLEGGRQTVALRELALVLREHVAHPNDQNRQCAFESFNSARRALERDPMWSAVMSNVQKLIDVATYQGPIDTSEYAMRSFVDKKVALRSIQDERERLKALKAREEACLREMFSREKIDVRVRSALSSRLVDRPNSFIVVGARQELTAIREHLDSVGARREQYRDLGEWSAERVRFDGDPLLDFGLVLSNGQGTECMSLLLSALQREGSPKNVLLVGMMAGIPGKSKLLDVQAPSNIINVIRQGTRGECIVSEPCGRDVDATLHHRLQALDEKRHNIADITLVTQKRSVCVAAKFDSLLPELAKAALASDPENVVGLEMEGAALTAMQSQQGLNNDSTRYLMIKGVADYAGSKPSQNEVNQLRVALERIEGPGAAVLLENPDPTDNKALKLALQRIATISALRVAIALLAEVLAPAGRKRI